LKNPLFSLQKVERLAKREPFLKSYTQKINAVRNNKTTTIDLDLTFEDLRHTVHEDIDKIRIIALKILAMIDHLSKKHNFKYFMSYGTLIGVVRHRGFIPWDDDIDIMMTRKDVDKLIAASYELPDSIDFYPQGLNFLKVMDKYSKISIDGKRGVAVDIFVLDKNRDDYSFINVHNQKKIKLKATEIFPLEQKPFENIDAPVPANYHELLTKIYGNYMELPPIEQRISHHVNNKSVHIHPFPNQKEVN